MASIQWVYFLLLLQLVKQLPVLVQSKSASGEAITTATSVTSSSIIHWYQEDEDDGNESKDTRRRIWWYGPLQKQGEGDSSPPWWRRKKANLELPPPMQHPLRTDAWKLTVRWRSNSNATKRFLLPSKNEPNDILFEFADNGYVRARQQQNGDATATPAAASSTGTSTGSQIGTWTLDPSGLSWTIPLNNTDHYFFADMHLNPFGKNPKMTRGVVIRDNASKSKWFRPIVGTFQGVGVGADTADLSYSHRNLGLSKQETQDS